MYGNNFQGISPIFDPRQVSFNISNAPQVPQFNVRFQDAVRFIPAIAAIAANEAARAATLNSARTLVFNQLFQNNLNNNDFFQLVATITETLGYLIARRNGVINSIDQDIKNIVQSTLALKTALLVTNDQQLASMMHPNDLQDAMNVINNNRAFVEEMNNFHRYMMNQGGGNMGGMVPQQFNQQPQQNPQFLQQPQQFFQQQPMNNQNSNFGNFGNNSNIGTTAGAGMVGGGSNRNFNVGGNPSAFQQQPMNNPQPIAGGHGNRNFNTPQLNENQRFNTFVSGGGGGNTNGVPQQPVVSSGYDFGGNVAPATPIQNQEPNNLVWKPSKFQPHRLGYDPLYKKIVLKTIQDEGQEIVIQIIVQLTEEEMDQARHTLAPTTASLAVSNARRIEVDMIRDREISSINDNGQADVMKFLKVPAEVEKGTDDSIMAAAGLDKDPCEDKEDDQTTWSDVGFIADTISSVRLHHAQMANSKTKMRRERFVVPKIFICKHGIKDLVSESLKDKSFLATASKLKAWLNSADITIEQKQFIQEFDKYLAYIVNHFMNDRLAVDNLWIDSFIDDVPTLFSGYLEKRCGPLIMEKLRDNQVAIYDTYLKQTESEEIQNSVSERFGTIEDMGEMDGDIDNVDVIVFEQSYTVTSIKVNSKDLRLEESIANSSRTIDSSYRALVTYCTKLFGNKENSKINWAGNLLLTTDGKIFNFSESTFVKGTYLAKEFDNVRLLP